MTKEKAIEVLKSECYVFNPLNFDRTALINTALDVAIESLKQPKTGHWIETAEEYYKAVNEYGGGVNENTPYFVDDIACSECLAKYSVIDNETERFDHCPSCGAKMVEPQERSGEE